MHQESAVAPYLRFWLQFISNKWSVIQVDYPVFGGGQPPFTRDRWKNDSDILSIAVLFCLLKIREVATPELAATVSASNCKQELDLNNAFRSLWNEHRKNVHNFTSGKKREVKSKWFIELFDPWGPSIDSAANEGCGVEQLLHRKGESVSGLISFAQGFHGSQVDFKIDGLPASNQELLHFVCDVLKLTEEQALYGKTLPHNDAPPSLAERFIGHVEDLMAIRAELAQPGLLILTGSFFVGKTQLALEARQYYLQSRAFPDGVYFVNFRLVQDASLVANAVLDAIQEREQPGVPAMDILKGSLRHKKLLLICDNCESHLDDCAQLADDLISTCKDLRILATSRHTLPVSVAHRTLIVRSLKLPATNRSLSLKDLEQVEAVRLFIEAAKAVDPSFRMTESNAHAIAALCHRTDGLPGCLKLAAGQVDVQSVDEILKGFPREKGVDDAIELSYNALDEKARLVFQATSVFVGEWSQDDARQVCWGSDPRGSPLDRERSSIIVSSLRRLRETSLLQVDAIRAESALFRYTSPIQQYARRKLREAGLEESVLERRLSSLLMFTERADVGLRGSESFEWMQRVEGKLDEIRGGLNWAFGNSKIEQASRIMTALRWYWVWHGRFREAESRFTHIIGLSSRGGTLLDAMVFDAAGLLALFGNHVDSAIERFTRGLVFFREVSDKGRIAWEAACLGLALIYKVTGNSMSLRQAQRKPLLQQGTELLQEGVSSARRLGDRYILGFVLICWGEYWRLEKKYENAFDAYKESEELFRGIGERFFINMALINLANMSIHKRDFRTAEVLLAETFEIELKSNHKLMLAYSLTASGAVAVKRKNFKRAAVLLGAVNTLIEELGISLQPTDQETYRLSRSEARKHFTNSRFDSLWKEGRSFSVERIIGYALEGLAQWSH